MLHGGQVLACDNHRMNKQPISVTLSPDNLVWLKGRARVEGTGSLSEFLDALVDNGTTYYYVVTAVDASNNESATSTEVSATPQGSGRCLTRASTPRRAESC